MMTDLEWARAFVGCKIEGTGYRFNETVDVLVKKLAQVREEASGHMRPPETSSESQSGRATACPDQRGRLVCAQHLRLRQFDAAFESPMANATY